MKKIISIIVATMLFTTLILGVGEGNLDGSGGSLGSATTTNSWSSGNDGVRVTVVTADTGSPVATPIDYTNKTPSGALHFGKVSKSHYRSGYSLSIQSNYTYKNPTMSLPTVIQAGGNISALKSYFTDRVVVDMISSDTGIPYDMLISGDYKLLLEPIAFLTFNGTFYAMTATEAGLYNSMLSGTLQSVMGALTHQNLPLSMYLATSDLGFSAWGGTSASRVTDSQISSYLGLGIVTFVEVVQPDPTDDIHYIYRTDTEVISAVTVTATSEITPDDNAYVRFTANGTTYSKQFVCPAGGSQLVWFKWTTPSDEQVVNIPVTTTKGRLDKSQINAQIVQLEENPPPDPGYYDRNDRFSLTTNSTNNYNNLANSWSEYWAWWQENWVWVETDPMTGAGYWDDQGWWEFEVNNYSMTVSATLDLYPNDLVVTASSDTMKSGFGVSVKANSQVSTNRTIPTYDYTSTQNAFAFFSEFDFLSYNRWLEKTGTHYEFKVNEFSHFGQRVHFTPLWYPDTRYEVAVVLFDMWTPAGQLYVTTDDYVNIVGDMYDDWTIRTATADEIR